MSQRASIDYISSVAPMDLRHTYLFSFYFLWWVKIRKDKKIGINFSFSGEGLGLGGGVSQSDRKHTTECSLFLYPLKTWGGLSK